MSRVILVQADKRFRLTIPDDAVLSFGPWSPPKDNGRYEGGPGDRRGTLRVYAGADKKEILGVFSGVISFRDVERLGYAEEIFRESGQVIWNDAEGGLMRESKVSRTTEWTDEAVRALTEGLTSQS